MDEIIEQVAKKTWTRYRIPDDLRGHRPRLSPGEKTLRLSVMLPQSIADKIARPHSRTLRRIIMDNMLTVAGQSDAV